MRRGICLVVALGAFASGPPWRWAIGPARADVVYELSPSIAAGATDNAAVNAAGEQHAADGFSVVGGSARLRYNGARGNLAFGYRGTYTRYLTDVGTTMFSNALMLTSEIRLSALWSLDFTATEVLSRTSGVDPNDPAVLFQQAATSGSSEYLATTAGQRLAYEPVPERRYEEVLSVSQVRFLERTINGVSMVPPSTTMVTLGLGGSRPVGRETYMLDMNIADQFVDVDPTGRGPFAQGHVFLGRVLAGWRHELAVSWSTVLQAGPSIIFNLDGDGVIAPAAIATLNYTRMPWVAALTATQTPAPNLYIGAATLSDQIAARVVVPLTRSERVYIGGNGGYLYARVADANRHMTRAYDQVVGSLSLALRFPGTRIATAATYNVVSQRGSSVPGYVAPDFARQAVLISVWGDVSWGPGTPPLFGGAL